MLGLFILSKNVFILLYVHKLVDAMTISGVYSL